MQNTYKIASDLRCFTLTRDLNPKNILQKVCLIICPHQITWVLILASGAFSGGSFTSKFGLLSSPKWSIFSPLLCWMVTCEESWPSEGHAKGGTFWSTVVVCARLLLWSTLVATADDRTVLQLRLLAWAIRNIRGLHASFLVIFKMIGKCRLPVLCLCCLPERVWCWEICLAGRRVPSGSQRDCFHC